MRPIMGSKETFERSKPIIEFSDNEFISEDER